MQLCGPLAACATSRDDGDAHLQSDGSRGDISARESDLNAEYRRELNTGSICQPRRIRVAHQKVANWPVVHDRRSVTVHAGKVFIPDPQASRIRAEQRLAESLALRHGERQAARKSLKAANIL